MEEKKRFLINGLYYSVIFFVILVCFLFLYRYCLLIIISYLTSAILKPAVKKTWVLLHINNQFFKGILTFVFVFVLYFLIVFLAGLTVLMFLRVFSFLPDYLSEIYQQLFNNRYLISISEQIYRALNSLFNELFSRTFQFALSAVVNLTAIISYLFFYYILTVLFILNEQTFLFIQQERFNRLFQLVQSVKKTLSIILKTYVILFIVTFLCLSIGFWCIGLENCFLIAFLIALFDFFPILGIDMIMIPWIIICALLNRIALALELLFVYLIVIILKNILEPHLLSKQMKIPALYMFITMIIMMKICGIVGMMISPFLLLVIKDMIDTGVLNKRD